MKETEKKKRISCAIYTRKSTSEGLDQDFTSLDNQRESAENYIKSQQHEGWIVLNDRYDDGGFTGANIERPALQKLLNDIKEGKINCVVVYKVDRLSRSLLDFSQLLEFFDKHNTTFVSVTQQFNTNTSMGRLTLNILLSFAQFEREIISERTRDKMGAARRRGQWTGGRPPLGYRIEKDAKKLSVNPNEAGLVKEIFDIYLKQDSLLKTAHTLNQRGLLTRPWTTKKGTTNGSKKFSVTQIQHVIKNVIYIGKIEYGGQIYEGQHPAIIDEETFKKVQEKLVENRMIRRATQNTDCSGLLTHLLKCKTCATTMFHTYTLKHGKHKYRYYLCSNAQKRGYNSCPNRSINAQAIEDDLITALRTTLKENKHKSCPHKTEVDALLSPVWDTLFIEEKRRILKTLLKEVHCDVTSRKIGFVFNDSNLRLEFDADVKKSRNKTTWRKETEITKEPKLRKTLILAHQLQKLMDQDRIISLKQTSEWLNLSPVRIDQALNLLLLSPAIQNDILSLNAQSLSLIPEYKMRIVINEFDWDKQTALWNELRSLSAQN